MKKIVSLVIVCIMLLCMVPMNAFAGDTLPGMEETLPGFHTRLAEINISMNGGYFNANSGASITNGGFVTSANALNIVNGFNSIFTIYVYQGMNEAPPASAPFNHYVGVVYFMGTRVSPSFYPLGDLLTVIYQSLECEGKTLRGIKWDALSFVESSFATENILGAVLNGSQYTWYADFGCTDHNFDAATGKCIICGEQVQNSYVVDDYVYTVISSDFLGTSAGWSVTTTNDKAKTSYAPIRNTLHGFPVTVMYKTFEGCSNMTVAPDIPANVQVVYNAYKGTAITSTPDMGNVVKLYGAFKSCKNLTNVGTIPATVTDMSFAFSGCTALVNAPAIPASVKNLTGAFKNCTSLTAAPDLSNAEVITDAFDGCTALSGSVTFNANSNSRAFRNTAVTDAVIGAAKIENGCFNNSDLADVTFAGTSAQWLGFDVGDYNAAVKSANVKLGQKAAAPSVVVKNKRTYICDIDGENVKDFFIAKGTQNTYADVKTNNVVRVTAQKIDGANIYTYGVALKKGAYTLYVRDVNGNAQTVNFTVA